MGHKGLKEPHLLLAASNPVRLMENLKGILSEDQIGLIDGALSLESKRLFELAESHRQFVKGLPSSEWRQCVSRLYYAAYNCRRAVILRYDGGFSTDSSDHQKVDKIPADIENSATYSQRLKDLREDRNLADYSHVAGAADLLTDVDDSRSMVDEFFGHARAYLLGRGVDL